MELSCPPLTGYTEELLSVGAVSATRSKHNLSQGHAENTKQEAWLCSPIGGMSATSCSVMHVCVC